MYGYSWIKEVFKNSGRAEGTKFSWDICSCYYLLSCKTVPCLPVGIWDVLPREQFLPFISIYKQCACYKNWDIYGAFILMSQESLCIIIGTLVSALKRTKEFPFDTDVFSEEQRVEPFVWQILACNVMLLVETQTLAWISLAATLWSSRPKPHVGVSLNLMYILPDVTCYTLESLSNFSSITYLMARLT